MKNEEKKIVVDTYSNGVNCKFENIELAIITQEENKNMIEFNKSIVGEDDLKTPTCRFEVVDDKKIVTNLWLSDTGIELLYVAIEQFLKYRQNQR